MLREIKPTGKYTKSKEGSLTEKEKPLAKGLLAMGYRAQDITYIINQGRISTVNQARVSQVQNDAKVKLATAEEIIRYLKIQASYDPKTLLNPYLNPRLVRAREAMITAVQIFNSPTLVFRTEQFCVLANIAWTYLLHEKMEEIAVGSSVLANGNSITVGGTLNSAVCPIKDAAVAANLKKIIAIRDAVEHTYYTESEECFGALFQACCVNFERYLREWFGENLSLSKELSLALQFVRLQKGQIVELEKSNLPKKIKAISTEIENSEFKDHPAFQLNVYYSSEVTSKTSADIHMLVSHDEASGHPVVAIKKLDYTRLTQAQLVSKVNGLGYPKFSGEDHRQFWMQKWKTAQERASKAKDYGEILNKNQWFWYEEKWLPLVLDHCKLWQQRFS